MTKQKGMLYEMRGWVVDHKLWAVGGSCATWTSTTSGIRRGGRRLCPWRKCVIWRTTSRIASTGSSPALPAGGKQPPSSTASRRRSPATDPGTLWLMGIAGSITYNWSRPGMKTSVKLIHTREHMDMHGEATMTTTSTRGCGGDDEDIDIDTGLRRRR